MNNDVQRAVEAENHDLKKSLEEKETLIKGLREEHLKQTLNLKRTIEELTNENHALNAMCHELEETVKNLNQTNSAVLIANKNLIGGVVMILSMIGKGMNNYEGD